MVEVLLLRHGKSDWDQDVPDFDRPLTERGLRDAERVGDWLKRSDLLPDRILSSPARRAIETAEHALKACGLGVSQLELDPSLYEAELPTLLDRIAAHKEGRLLLVGHNPGLDLALQALSDSPPRFTPDGKLMTTANLAHLRRREGQSYELVELLRPEVLPRKFEYKTENGVELRKRPAYYYTQAGVIPYRFRDNKIEFLLVTTNKGKWSIPKGVVEPGMTPQASAAREGREEGGIVGNVENSLLGSLTVRKWGASCALNIYGMHVDSLMPEGQWESHKRDRQWFSLDRAVRSVNLLEVGPIMSQMAAEKQPHAA